VASGARVVELTMICERTFEGLEIRLQPRGAGRFVAAAFLGLWLCFWIVGEVGVLFVLGAGAWSMATGEPLAGEGAAPGPGTAVFVGLFLLVWLTIWTVGGVAAMRELGRLLFGRERIIARPDGLRIVRTVGPFSRVQELSRTDLRRLYRLASGLALMAETPSGPVEVTRMAAPGELAELEAILRAELALSEKTDDSPATLPGGWCEEMLDDGGRVLVKDPVARRQQARVTTALAAVAAMGALWLVLAAASDSELAVLAVVATAVATAIGWGAAWLTWGRHEWLIARGRLERRSRFRGRPRTRFVGVGLELTESTDSDGDRRYEIVALAGGAAAAPLQDRQKHRRAIASVLHDPTVPRALGRWLEAQTGIAVRDLTQPEAKAAEIDALKAQLAASGSLGRWAARMLDKRGR
jgi:hypothetical protein